MDYSKEIYSLYRRVANLNLRASFGHLPEKELMVGLREMKALIENILVLINK